VSGSLGSKVAAVAWVFFAVMRFASAEGFTKREMRVPGEIGWVTHGDLNADGWTDLVVSYHRGGGPSATRFLGVFFGAAQGFGRVPDHAFVVPERATVFDVGDVFGDRGDEVVYGGANGVYAHSVVPQKVGKVQRVAAVRSLMGGPNEDELVMLNLVRNVEGQGTLLIVPAQDGLVLFRRGADGFETAGRVATTHFGFYDAEMSTYRVSARGGETGRPYWFRSATVVPNIDFIEQTGDGQIDMVLHLVDRVWVFASKGPNAGFQEAASTTRWFRLLTDEERSQGVVSTATMLEDLDGDGIGDLAFSKMTGGARKLHSSLYLFRGEKGGGFSKEAVQVFEDDAFANLVSFADLDGDGLSELLRPKLVVSILELTKIMVSSEVTVDLRIHRPQGGRGFFAAHPDFTMEMTFPIDFSARAQLEGPSPLAGYDFNGDGLKDMMLAGGSEGMVLHRGERDDGSYRLEEEGRYHLKAPGSHLTIVLPRRPADLKKPDVLVYYRYRAKLSGIMVHFRNEF
jgi:hypothetical protein